MPRVRKSDKGLVPASGLVNCWLHSPTLAEFAVDRILILPVAISTIPEMQATRNAAHTMVGTKTWWT
jgi:hypothetical protein